jgi:hypothetical protein
MRLTAVCIAIVALGTAACSGGSSGSSGSSSGSSTGSSGSETGSTGSGTGSTGSGTGTSSGSSTGPTVSFTNDILPVFVSDCAISGIGCHGTNLVPSSADRPFLGNAEGTTSPSSVLPGIVNAPSYEDPKLDIVKANDATNSYMIIKLLGNENNYLSDCMSLGHNSSGQGGACGLQMPGSGSMLDSATITLIENWINQGAQNN